MLEELKKAFQFIVNRKRPYRFILFFAGLKGKKICTLISSTITATPKEAQDKYFKGYNIVYWDPGFFMKLIMKWFGHLTCNEMLKTFASLHVYIKAEKAHEQRFI